MTDPVCRVAFVAESEQAIGTGHAVETIALLRACVGFGIEPRAVFTAGTPQPLLDGIKTDFETIDEPDEKTLRDTAARLAWDGVSTVVTNFRRITEDQIQALRDGGLRTVCIDELGGRTIHPDVIVNTSIVRTFQVYPGTRARVLAGPAYLPLDTRFSTARTKRNFPQGVRAIAVSMGGTDRTQATRRVVASLRNVSEIRLHIVVGPGFTFTEALAQEVAGCAGQATLHRTPPKLQQILGCVDVGITAGGNTLYELACLGTPALVLFEDEHERLQGEAFEAAGFGRCLGQGVSFQPEALLSAIEAMDEAGTLSGHSEAGRKLVDGRGVERVLSVVREISKY